MKTIIFLLLFLTIAKIGWAQEVEIYEVRGDSLKKHNLGQKIKKGSSIQFKFPNVNIFRISGSAIIIGSSNINYGNGESLSDNKFISMFSNLDILTLFGINKPKEINAPKLQNGEVNATINPKYAETEENQFMEEYANFGKTLYQIKARANLGSRLWNLLTLNDSIFIENATLIKANAKYIYNSLDITDRYSTENLMDQLQSSYNKLLQLYKVINREIEGATAPLRNPEKCATQMDFLKKIMQTIDDSQKREEIIKKVDASRLLYDEILGNSFVAHSNPIQLNNDVDTIAPELIFKNGKTAYNKYPSYTFKTYGGMRVNFSAGYLLSFTGDDNYNVQKNSEGVPVGVVKANPNHLKHALGGLIHVYKEWNWLIKPAFSTGASITDNANLGFYAGASAIFAEKNRFVLTAGLSYIKIKKLDRTNLSRDNEFIYKTDTEIKYDNIYRPAFFVGITYNFGK